MEKFNEKVATENAQIMNVNVINSIKYQLKSNNPTIYVPIKDNNKEIGGVAIGYFFNAETNKIQLMKKMYNIKKFPISNRTILVMFKEQTEKTGGEFQPYIILNTEMGRGILEDVIKDSRMYN